MDYVLDLAPCYYFSSGDDGIILEANGTLCRELGYSREELQGRKAESIFTLATRIFYQTHFFPLLKMQGFASEIFISLLAKNGDHVPVLINARRQEAEGGARIAYAGITVPNRKKFEDELVAARKAAETALLENTALMTARAQLQRQMEELDRHMQLTRKQHEELRQFNRVVTHDLQEPLRKMSVFGHMLMDGIHRQVTTNPLPVVEKLLRVTETMRSVISGLQQYIWLTDHPEVLTQLNITDLLPEVQAQLQKDFPEATLLLEAAPVPAVPAYRDQIRLLLYQLLANAVRFRKTGPEARVRISGTIVQQNSFRNISGKYSYQDFLKLYLSDEGTGFDPVYRHQIFDLFKRFHENSGQGIGLSLCKKVIENHAGTITADSSPGGGTTFTILLPLRRPAGEVTTGGNAVLTSPLQE